MPQDTHTYTQTHTNTHIHTHTHTHTHIHTHRILTHWTSVIKHPQDTESLYKSSIHVDLFVTNRFTNKPGPGPVIKTRTSSTSVFPNCRTNTLTYYLYITLSACAPPSTPSLHISSL
ncbi:hypothetical protein EYF80_064618 [Liparis tanakae]|uniref:Uncharacterized protein n=1 Tax=Liparis tanakae TaxID=230148 RepID=A0A4Z2E9Q4_9TELE|nr:hypothetical protein EYF80_064618 [Liparis tanakae]